MTTGQAIFVMKSTSAGLKWSLKKYVCLYVKEVDQILS